MSLRILAFVTVCWLAAAAVGSAVPVAGTLEPTASEIWLGVDPLGWPSGTRGIECLEPLGYGPAVDPQGWSPDADVIEPLAASVTNYGPAVDPEG